MTTTPDNFAPATEGGPRSWRDRPVYRVLFDALTTGDEPDTDTLQSLLLDAQPNDPEAFTKAVVAAAAEAVELDEQGAQGPARDVIRQRAEEIDEKFETTDAVRDRKEQAKTDRQTARQARLDPTALAAGVPDHRIR